MASTVEQIIQQRVDAAPTLATISANSYAWGYNFTFPEAAISALRDSGNIASTFSELLGVIPPELKSVTQVVEAHLEADLASARAVDKGAGVYLTATWAAPEVLVPAPIDWGFITSYLENTLVLDVAGASPEPETPLHVWPYKSSDNADQQWTYVNNLYLVGQQSGLVVEIANSDPGDGAAVQINNFTGAPNQQWSICGDGFIRSLMNGNVLDVSGGSPVPATPVISYHPKYPPLKNPPTNQGWSAAFAPTLDCNCLVTVVANNTTNNLIIAGAPSAGTVLTYPQDPSQFLLAGSVAVYVSAYYGANEMSFAIYDHDYSTQNPVASFDAHQHECVLEAGDVWADTQSWQNGYILNSQKSDWYGGSYPDQGGIIVCSVDYQGG